MGLRRKRSLWIFLLVLMVTVASLLIVNSKPKTGKYTKAKLVFHMQEWDRSPGRWEYG